MNLNGKTLSTYKIRSLIQDGVYRRIHADVIVYIFAHLHKALRTEENMLGKN